MAYSVFAAGFFFYTQYDIFTILLQVGLSVCGMRKITFVRFSSVFGALRLSGVG